MRFGESLGYHEVQDCQTNRNFKSCSKCQSVVAGPSGLLRSWGGPAACFSPCVNTGPPPHCGQLLTRVQLGTPALSACACRAGGLSAGRQIRCWSHSLSSGNPSWPSLVGVIVPGPLCLSAVLPCNWGSLEKQVRTDTLLTAPFGAASSGPKALASSSLTAVTPLPLPPGWGQRQKPFPQCPSGSSAPLPT